MGSSAVLRTKTHLEKLEINEITLNNQYIQSVMSTSNQDKLINLSELNSMTKGIIKEKILKKIIQICGSKKNSLTNEDFGYFYSLLITNSFDAKLNFLLDFIFIKKNKIFKEKYIHKVNVYFENSKLLLDIFLDKKLIDDSINFSRDNVLSFIVKNHSEELKDYNLLKSVQNNLTASPKSKKNKKDNNDKNEKEDLKNNNNTDDSLTLENEIVIRDKKYENLEPEFRRIESQNNGVFPITVFETMLSDIGVKEILIEIICNYLQTKAQKSFINFELFKEILNLLISESDHESKIKKHIITALFTFISYPKNSTKKSTLINIFKKEELFNGIENNKNIKLKEFLSIWENTKAYNIIKSLENIKYLKYIYFDADIDDNRWLEYEIITILLIKQKSMSDYISKRLQTDTNFYLIDVEFWNQWNKLIIKFNEQRNYNELRKLKIRTNNFCDKNGQILEDKKFSEDYLIISEIMHSLFIKWYGPEKGGEIKRSKIYLEQKDLIKSDKLTKSFRGFDKSENKYYELELNPYFIALYHYLEFKKILNYEKKELEKQISNIYKNANFISSSRKSKFSELYNNDNNHRFWIYIDGKLKKVNNNDTLEEYDLPKKCIVLIEEKINNKWQSELSKKDSLKSNTSREEENLEEDSLRVGFYNIGNTCYMNSVLQLFMNIKELKNIFIHKKVEDNKKFLSFILNFDNKEVNRVVKRSGYLILELINLLKFKWLERQKTLNPRKFKEICGEYNPIFKTSEQQDAHDFYTFLIDKLHEETNIKYDKNNTYKDLTNSEIVDTDELDLGNESWANNIRKNASYFYALFMGQLKSTLICAECNHKKIKFEPFSALELPIPEGTNITIDIILFRLPYSLRKEFDIKKVNRNENNEMETRLSNRYSTSFKKSNNKNNMSSNFSDISFDNLEKTEVINSSLNLNIPLRLRMEIGRKEKCSTIIDKLKCMNDLNIEKYFNFTEFIMISQNKFISEDLIVDSTLSDNNIVQVYEIINFEGIKNIHDYDEIKDWKILEINNQKINYNSPKIKNKKKLMTNAEKNGLKFPVINFDININNLKSENYNSYEILIPIIHRYRSNSSKELFSYIKYEYFYKFRDYIILSSENSIKPYDLYEMMWQKYKYFLDSPVNYVKKSWWKQMEKATKELPFKIALINKETLSCSICPWFRFCQGCTLEPKENEFINIKNDDVIAIEWDKDVYNKEINKNNLSLIMNHKSVETTNENKSQQKDEISLDDCLKLFTKEEELVDVQCEKCNKKTLFKKTLQIERLPQYLVIVLKRFKYILTNSVKLKNLITFPLDELSLQNYVSQKNINYRYTLFGIINHSGSIEWGHYYSNFNVNGTWVNYDDSHVTDIPQGLETKKAYILIYKSNEVDKNAKNVYFLGLMNRAYKVYISNLKFKFLFNYEFDDDNNIKKQHLLNCEFYYGEPVTVSGKRGFIVNIEKNKDGKKEKKQKEEKEEKDKDDEENKEKHVNIKIKLKKGFYSQENINIDDIQRETYKEPNDIDIDNFLNQESAIKKINENESEVVCGSKVCTIF